MAFYMLFGILWITAWIEYANAFIVMVGAATYYFDSGPAHGDEVDPDSPDGKTYNQQEVDGHAKVKEGKASLSLGWKYAYLNHSGSIAAGAFILALIRFVEIVFVYAAKKAEKMSGENKCVKIIVACGACYLKCLEKICDYINKAAFAYMAVTGDGFCFSAWNGFLLHVKHLAKFSFANWLAGVFIFLGKLAIVIGNCFFCYFLMGPACFAVFRAPAPTD